jgi:transposase
MAVATVIIGVDPHKGSHTAVAVGGDEMPLGQVRVRSCPSQAEQLLDWAQAWPQRAWAVEGARGMGYLLAQQLVTAGEQVLDVQPKLGARVRLLNAGDVNKNDPNDARSVAVAALRSPGPQVRADDHATVLKVWSKRYRDLGRSRTQTACRLHAVLCELIPGGVSKRLSVPGARQVLASVAPADAVAAARCALAADLIADLDRADALQREARKKINVAVRASGTSLTSLFGVGPVVAATIIGEVRDVTRFPGRDHFAAYNGTAPIEVSSGRRRVYRLSRRGNRRINHAIHMAAVTQVSHSGRAGRAYFDKKIAEGKTPKEALRSLKRQVSDAVFTRLRADAQRAAARSEDPGGQTGNGSAYPARPACTPHAGSSGKPLPDPATNPTAVSADPEPREHTRPFLDSCQVPAVGEAAGQGGAPAAKRGRTTLTGGKTTATLGHEESPRKKTDPAP